MIITILIIIGVIVETILIGNTLISLKLIDNEKDYDKEFWNEENINES